jgi:hypothetical protein
MVHIPKDEIDGQKVRYNMSQLPFGDDPAERERKLREEVPQHAPQQHPGPAVVATVKQAIHDVLAEANEQHSELTRAENRDQLFDRIAQHPLVAPLLERSVVTRQQLMEWIEEEAVL